MPATPVWLAALEALFDRGIHGSPQAAALARRLNGTALRLDIDGVADIRASVVGDRLALATQSAATAEHSDAIVSGAPLALLQLARGHSHRSIGLAKTKAVVRGDAEIADLYRQLFTLARPDWEDELARVVGDVPARRLSQLAKQAFGWARQARHTAGENVAEYLQEESRVVVGKPELDEFLQGVDGLREIADRIEMRLAALERRRQGSS